MDRRDFLKTVAITGAALSIQHSEAMEILTQTINNTNGGNPDLVAVMGWRTGSYVPPCYQRTGRYETIRKTGTEGGRKT